jgi:hypothetical protein
MTRGKILLSHAGPATTEDNGFCQGRGAPQLANYTTVLSDRGDAPHSLARTPRRISSAILVCEQPHELGKRRVGPTRAARQRLDQACNRRVTVTVNSAQVESRLQRGRPTRAHRQCRAMSVHTEIDTTYLCLSDIYKKRRRFHFFNDPLAFKIHLRLVFFLWEQPSRRIVSRPGYA